MTRTYLTRRLGENPSPGPDGARSLLSAAGLDHVEILPKPFERVQLKERLELLAVRTGRAPRPPCAEVHGGRVSIGESSEEAGTTFIIDLPSDSRPFQPSGTEHSAGFANLSGEASL